MYSCMIKKCLFLALILTQSPQRSLSLESLVLPRGHQQDGDTPHHNDHQHQRHQHQVFHNTDTDTDDHQCGTEKPVLRDELVDQLRFRQAFADPSHRRRLQIGCSDLCNQCIEIETYLHLITSNIVIDGVMNLDNVIPHPTGSVVRAMNGDVFISRNNFSTVADIETLFQDNIDVVNAAFGGTPFRFTFVRQGTTQTVNNTWSNNALIYQREISRFVGNRDLQKLDCFVAWNMAMGLNGTILGAATFPSAQLAGRGDGIVMRYDVLAGGGFTNRDLGYTLVHEIGHWLGLLHTFQTILTTDGCSPMEQEFGDFVYDTPLQNGPSSRNLNRSCTTYLSRDPPDTCPLQEGRDALFNYMNYIDNQRCQQEGGYFTCGQIERMHRHYLLFRERMASCKDARDVEIEIIVNFNAWYSIQSLILLRDDAGNVLFDSLEDHLVSSIVFGTETFLINLCVPRSQMYILSVEHQDNSTFLRNDGLEVYVDGVLIERITGDIGQGLSVTIVPPEATLVPSDFPSESPSVAATNSPSLVPSALPSLEPTHSPSTPPTQFSSESPSQLPSRPTEDPTDRPSDLPTEFPSRSPLSVPPIIPTRTPTLNAADPLQNSELVPTVPDASQQWNVQADSSSAASPNSMLVLLIGEMCCCVLVRAFL